MTPDLEALSREIAATSDDWMVPGVRMLLDGHRAARVVVRNRIFVEATYRDLLYTPLPGDIPDLADPVTVNSLLGDKGVVELVYFADYRASIGNGCSYGPARTIAICRAWIAAHKGEE